MKEITNLHLTLPKLVIATLIMLVATVKSAKFNNDFDGYAFFEYRGRDVGENYSRGNFTEAYVNGELDEVELSATMHYELRTHILILDVICQELDTQTPTRREGTANS